MALIKSHEEISRLREGGRILNAILNAVAEKVSVGISTFDLEDFAVEEIKKSGAKPAFKGYRPHHAISAYPAALCTSVNEEVVHCYPKNDKILRDGDIISIDLGIEYKGLFTDSALTVPVGKIDANIQKLIDGTREGLMAGIKMVKPGNRVGDISNAIQKVGERYGFGIVRDLVGHGVGHSIHELPNIPNYGEAGSGDELREGMVLALEPMFTLGGWEIRFEDDGWTVTTADYSLSAHFEHTIAVVEKGNLIITGD